MLRCFNPLLTKPRGFSFFLLIDQKQGAAGEVCHTDRSSSLPSRLIGPRNAVVAVLWPHCCLRRGSLCVPVCFLPINCGRQSLKRFGVSLMN